MISFNSSIVLFVTLLSLCTNVLSKQVRYPFSATRKVKTRTKIPSWQEPTARPLSKPRNLTLGQQSSSSFQAMFPLLKTISKKEKYRSNIVPTVDDSDMKEMLKEEYDGNDITHQEQTPKNTILLRHRRRRHRQIQQYKKPTLRDKLIALRIDYEYAWKKLPDELGLVLLITSFLFVVICFGCCLCVPFFCCYDACYHSRKNDKDKNQPITKQDEVEKGDDDNTAAVATADYDDDDDVYAESGTPSKHKK